MAFDRRDHRLGQYHSGGTHRPFAAFGEPVAAPAGKRLQVRAGAKRSLRARQNSYSQTLVRIELSKSIDQRFSRRAIYSVAYFRAVDGHNKNIALRFGQNCTQAIPFVSESFALVDRSLRAVILPSWLLEYHRRSV